jgi:hypothetical protein
MSEAILRTSAKARTLSAEEAALIASGSELVVYGEEMERLAVFAASTIAGFPTEIFFPGPREKITMIGARLLDAAGEAMLEWRFNFSHALGDRETATIILDAPELAPPHHDEAAAEPARVREIAPVESGKWVVMWRAPKTWTGWNDFEAFDTRAEAEAYLRENCGGPNSYWLAQVQGQWRPADTSRDMIGDGAAFQGDRG